MSNQIPFQKCVVSEKNRRRECQAPRREHAWRHDTGQRCDADRHRERSSKGTHQDGKPPITEFLAESLGVKAVLQKFPDRTSRIMKAHDDSRYFDTLQKN
ncbi:hypothetical protein [Burkholderia stagnalis]|uniref:hypothetical protein n=1 Tax=Burkholderia stagnalis TaxID=1503054 RepID=UPI0013DFC136|nr:hypothetical protein [Burkholderia stagnalis]